MILNGDEISSVLILFKTNQKNFTYLPVASAACSFLPCNLHNVEVAKNRKSEPKYDAEPENIIVTELVQTAQASPEI